VSRSLWVPTAILVGMSSVAWGVVVALVGMFVNLGFNLDNRRRIEAEPGRQVQRQLNDKVRPSGQIEAGAKRAGVRASVGWRRGYVCWIWT